MSLGLLACGVLCATAFLTNRAGHRAIFAAAPAETIQSIDSVPSPAGPGSAEPNLAVGRSGEVYLSWLEPADSGYALRLSVFKGKGWSQPTTIRAGRDFFVNWADFPSVRVLEGNRLAVHWLQRTGKTTYAYGVRIAQSADGGKTWGAPVTPHRDTATSAEHGFVAMWPQAGALGAVWLDGRHQHGGHGGDMTLMATTIAANGTLGPETVLDSRTCDCCQNAVAQTSAGPIVAYRNRTADEIRDIYVTRLVRGKWTEGVAVHDDGWKINACPVNGPAIAAAGNRVAVAWFGAPRDTFVKVAFSGDGGATFGKPARVDGGRPGGRVDIVMLPDASALVSWIERTGGDTAAVRARRVTPDGALGGVRTIATSSTARASGFPRMVVAGSRVVFAWTVPSRPSAVRVASVGIAELR